MLLAPPARRLSAPLELVDRDGSGALDVEEFAAGRESVERKPLIVAGMLLQAGALGLLAISHGALATAIASAVLLGLGIALVYPNPDSGDLGCRLTGRARADCRRVSLWRDTGYALGALIAGATADAFGYGGAMTILVALTAASGLWVLADMPAERRERRSARESGNTRGDVISSRAMRAR